MIPGVPSLTPPIFWFAISFANVIVRDEELRLLGMCELTSRALATLGRTAIVRKGEKPLLREAALRRVGVELTVFETDVRQQRNERRCTCCT